HTRDKSMGAFLTRIIVNRCAVPKQFPSAPSGKITKTHKRISLQRFTIGLHTRIIRVHPAEARATVALT
ncbi:MAG: hypothetical protein WB755_22025, partial [Terriglobales bacterium]